MLMGLHHVEAPASGSVSMQKLDTYIGIEGCGVRAGCLNYLLGKSRRHVTTLTALAVTYLRWFHGSSPQRAASSLLLEKVVIRPGVPVCSQLVTSLLLLE